MSKYKPGQSGNPKGRPSGGPDRRREFRELIRDAVPELIAKALELAREGDTVALRLLLDRAVPPVKPETQPVCLNYSLQGGLSRAAQAILAEVASGDASPDLAKSLMETLSVFSKIVESDELVKRIEALEQRKD